MKADKEVRKTIEDLENFEQCTCNNPTIVCKYCRAVTTLREFVQSHLSKGEQGATINPKNVYAFLSHWAKGNNCIPKILGFRRKLTDAFCREFGGKQEVRCEEIREVIEKHKWNIAKYVMENKTLDVGQSSHDLAQALKDKFIIMRR